VRKKLQYARTLSLNDWFFLLQAWWMLLLVDLGLRLIAFIKLQKMLAKSQRRRQGRAFTQDMAIAEIQRERRLVRIASRRHFYPMTCLRRSLTLQWLLARRGIATELRIGVKKSAAQKLEAHAWLEYNRLPIGEPEKITEQYAILAAIPSQEQVN
jgi:hypothetical protein